VNFSPDMDTIGDLLRTWRARRGLTQLALSLELDVSTRHLSFVENGRARPGRELVLLLCERLDVPLRERNRMLVTAGFAPEFQQRPIDAAELESVRAALRVLVDAYAPYPALVMDAAWNLIDANVGCGVLLAGVDLTRLTPPLNSLQLALGAGGSLQHVENAAEWRAHLYLRAERSYALTQNAALGAVLATLPPVPSAQPMPGAVALPYRLKVGAKTLTFLTTIAAFPTALDVTVAELTIETFVPADDATRAHVAAWRAPPEVVALIDALRASQRA
jgi:transcriptional regulator with XRE-family HTH domain